MHALSPQDPQQRAAMAVALAAALAVQALFVIALMSTHIRYRADARETILYFQIAQPRATAAERTIRATPQQAPPLPVVRPSMVAPPLTSSPPGASSATGFEALHGLLFDCSPDQTLTDEERKRCESTAGAPKPDVAASVRIGPERSKDAVHWARALARKQAPALLPCASAYGIGVSIYTLYCIGKGAIEGFDLDAQPGYFDKPATTHVPNSGDPKPLYQPIHE